MWQVKQVEPSQDVRTHRDAGIKNRTGGEDTKDSTDGFTERASSQNGWQVDQTLHCWE
jgi:hypothetical protein